MTEIKKVPTPLHDHYLDEDDLGKEFCDHLDCNACYGSDHEGEANGYGCTDHESFMDKYGHLVMSHEEAYEHVLKKLDKTDAILKSVGLDSRIDRESIYCGNCRFRLSTYVDHHGCVLFGKLPHVTKSELVKPGRTIMLRCQECLDTFKKEDKDDPKIEQ